jgi:hypothetical protein
MQIDETLNQRQAQPGALQWVRRWQTGYSLSVNGT